MASKIWGSFSFGQIHALGVASAFKVEDRVFGPAVFIIADEFAIRVSTRGGLTGTAQSEEDSSIAILTHVGRAVHGQHALCPGAAHS